MTKVSIEVRNGATHFAVAVRAESLRRAMSIVKGRYPGCEVRMKFPIDPEGFFVQASAARAGTVEFERPEKTAA